MKKKRKETINSIEATQKLKREHSHKKRPMAIRQSVVPGTTKSHPSYSKKVSPMDYNN